MGGQVHVERKRFGLRILQGRGRGDSIQIMLFIYNNFLVQVPIRVAAYNICEMRIVCAFCELSFQCGA